MRTGRCDDFGEAAAAMARAARAAARASRASCRSRSAATGTHPWSRWQDQRIIDTPHYRRNDELLRYVVWRNNTFGLHVHVGIRGADRAIAVHDALRNFLPELLALSASSPFVEDVDTGLHSARTEIFTRMFPRCGIPDAYGGWQRVRGLRLASSTAPARSPSTRRSGGACGRTSPTRRSRSASATASPTSPRRRRSPRSSTRSPRGARARYDEGEPLPDLPHRLLEENLWRAIRYGLSGELIDFERGESIPARARLEQLLDWVAPVADEIGAAPFLAVPEQNAAERQIARVEEGATCEEIYAEQVQAGEPSQWLSDESSPPRRSQTSSRRSTSTSSSSPTASTPREPRATRSSSGGDLGQARLAIDALGGPPAARSRASSEATSSRR